MPSSIRPVSQRQSPAGMALIVGTRTEFAAPLIADRFRPSGAGGSRRPPLSP